MQLTLLLILYPVLLLNCFNISTDIFGFLYRLLYHLQIMIVLFTPLHCHLNSLFQLRILKDVMEKLSTGVFRYAKQPNHCSCLFFYSPRDKMGIPIFVSAFSVYLLPPYVTFCLNSCCLIFLKCIL